MEAVVFIQDVYNITLIGPIPVGRVEKGTLKVGMQANIQGKIMTVNTIEMKHQQIKEAHEGDSVGFTLKNGDLRLLRSVMRTAVTFSDSGVPVSITLQLKQAGSSEQNPVKPEGALSFLKKFFR